MENITFAKDDFEFAQKDEKLTDTKFDTKPIGYFKDAWLRFKKSKAAIVGAVVIILIVLYALITPLASPHTVGETDGIYQKMVAYNEPLSNHLKIADGTYDKKCNVKAYLNLVGISISYEDKDGASLDVKAGDASSFNPVREISDPYKNGATTYRDCSVQAYYEKGFVYYQWTQEVIDSVKEFEASTGLQIMYPMVDTSLVESSVYAVNANYWYQTTDGYPVDSKGNKITTVEGMANVANAYLVDSNGEIAYTKPLASSEYQVRVFYWNYYRYKNNGAVPNYLFGTDDLGRDIAVRLASGIRLSLILAVSTFVVNFAIGAIYGSIEGYYGGVVDILMERVTDILADIPFIVLASIVNIKYISTGKMSSLGAVIFAFVLTGWIGPAYRVRTQFYRFKNEEYVLAARTLGASDARIMWKHIFPNTLGTIITASVLTIPGTIFTESMLSYLKIISLNSGGVTSLGTMLSTGQAYMTTYPHIIVPPAVVISLLMISFNLFGNGLRDAFNPSLRGVEE
jgi:oligopeptide transport system permease protein